MTYKEKMKTEHPNVDSNFVLFSCPGHFFENGPSASDTSCPKNDGSGGGSCVDCWHTEIPGPKPETYTSKADPVLQSAEIPELESSEKTMVKVIANRVKALYCAFRDEGLNDHEAFDITKIIIAEEIRTHESSVF